MIRIDPILQEAYINSNINFCKSFKKDLNFHSLQIMEKYAKIILQNGYHEEIPYNINPEDFQRKIYNMFESN